MANDLPEPASRKEQFLAKAAGENVELPTPASREELYLNAIANNGGGGGGGGDAGLFLVRASETTSKSQTPEGSDLQQYAGQTGLYINDQYTDISAQGAGNIYYVYSIGEDPETGDAYAEYALIANQQELWATVGNIADMMPIGGGGAPDSSTPGIMGQLYIDVAGSSLYVCIDDSDPYVWQQLGGGGVNVVQTTGTSTTDVMSQDATTGMVFRDKSTKNQVQIGRDSNASGTQATALGSGTTASGIAGVAIGGECQAIAQNSVAFAQGQATVQGEFNVGTSYNWSSGGYKGTAYRVIRGVHDGEQAHDAVTVGQINALIDAINSATNSNISHIGS
jgi:hypothetical protein